MEVLWGVKMSDLNQLDQMVYCSHCKGKRDHFILSTYSASSNHDDDFHWSSNYHIIQCGGCRTIGFVERYSDEDSWEYDYNGDTVVVEKYFVYPEEPKEKSFDELLEEKSRLVPKNFKNVPDYLNVLYIQIVESFNMKHEVLCVSGLRTLIEGVCSHLGIKKGFYYDENKNKLPDKDGKIKKQEGLGARIFGLYENEYVLFDHALILQKIKDIGNQAIHEMEAPDHSTITDIIKVIESILDNIFEIKGHKLLAKS